MTIEKFIKSYLRRIGILIVCALVSAVTINWLILPHQLNTGGVGGIAQILFYLYDIPPWVTTIMISVPVLLAGVRIMNLEFCLLSCVGAGLFSLFLGITQHFAYPTFSILISSFAAAILLGVCCGMVFCNQATLGGMATVTFLLQKVFHRPAGTFDNMINVLILIISAVTVGVDTLLPSILCIIGSNMVLNHIVKKYMLK